MSERSEKVADDPFGGRRPTSHERMTGRPWDASYHDGPAPWDIGRPQMAVVRLASAGGFASPQERQNRAPAGAPVAGAVLDVGCGTGDNALHIASLGLPVLGVDVAETGVTIARQRAEAAARTTGAIDVEFLVADAFRLESLGRKFQTVIDSGLFHTLDPHDPTFDPKERARYVASLASVTEHGGTLYVLCFSNQGPDTGPHPISQEELRAAFNPSTGWNVGSIKPERLQTRFHGADGAPAWLATIKRI